MREMQRMYNIVPHDPENGSYGDCHRNCIAMLLGLDQNEVPHFYDGYNKTNSAELNKKMNLWLAKRGVAVGDVIYDADLVSVAAVLKSTAAMMPRIPLILGGESSKGCNHSVVVLDGEIWCDPSGSGIVGPIISDNPNERYYWITFLALIPDWIEPKKET